MSFSLRPAFAGNYKLRTKMFFLTAVVFIGFLLSTLMGTYILNDVRIGSKTYRTIKNNSTSLEKIALLKSDISQVDTRMTILLGEKDRGRIAQIQSEIQLTAGESSDKFSEILNLMDSKEKKEAISEASGVWQEFTETLQKELIEAVVSGDLARARTLAEGTQKERYTRCAEAIDRAVDALKTDVHELEANTDKAVKKKIIFSGVISGAIFLFIFIATLIITRSITRPIVQGVQFARSVAGGNLSERLSFSAGGEIGELTDSLNSMAGSLQTTVGRVNRTAEELTGIAHSIMQSSRMVMGGAELQATGVGETSTAVTEINASVTKVASGMDILATSADESSSSILEMTASIEEVALNMEMLARAVEEVSSSIIEMNASIKQIGQSVQILKEDAAATASSVVAMDGSIRQIKQNAADAAAISDEVRRDAETGQASVEATIIGINDIRDSSHITSEVVTNLSRRAADIGAILQVIDDVAEQTNLLALNAAIIAAQAGVHGKGFAVVSEEIKELAQRTSRSTREIAQLITGVQEEASRAVTAISRAEKSIADGELLSRKSGEALLKIVAGVQRTTDQVNGIALATGEQAHGSSDIRQAMDRISEMVGQIANASREQAKGSEQIMTAVSRMKGLTIQVHNSTREQTKTGSFIASSTEDITGMIRQIKKACDEQTRESEKIVSAVVNIRQSTGVNLEAARDLDEAAIDLSAQISTLQTEMSGFKIGGEAAPSAKSHLSGSI